MSLGCHITARSARTVVAIQHNFRCGDYALGISLHWLRIPQTILSLVIVSKTSGTLFEFGILGMVVRLIVCVMRYSDNE